MLDRRASALSAGVSPVSPARRSERHSHADREPELPNCQRECP
ncbi:hypothetical protein [Caproicibacter sp. BJN0012]